MRARLGLQFCGLVVCFAKSCKGGVRGDSRGSVESRPKETSQRSYSLVGHSPKPSLVNSGPIWTPLPRYLS